MRGELRSQGSEANLTLRPAFPFSSDGLCTFGHAARSLVSFFPNAHLRLMRVRFSSPVFPGETLQTEAWKVRENANEIIVAFRTKVTERNVVVLNSCVARFVKDGSKL